MFTISLNMGTGSGSGRPKFLLSVKLCLSTWSFCSSSTWHTITWQTYTIQVGMAEWCCSCGLFCACWLQWSGFRLYIQHAAAKVNSSQKGPRCRWDESTIQSAEPWIPTPRCCRALFTLLTFAVTAWRKKKFLPSVLLYTGQRTMFKSFLI